MKSVAQLVKELLEAAPQSHPAKSSSTKRLSSPTPSAGTKRNLSPTLKALAYLRPLLPQGSERFFSVRGAGKYYGLKIACPHCPVELPEGMSPYRKWRWLAAHVAIEHKGK